MFKAVFFDLDETLLNAAQCHDRADEEVFAYFGLDIAEAERKTAHHDFFGNASCRFPKNHRETLLRFQKKKLRLSS